MKGVILAAGYGTRFLPATKTIPKEMFPLVDTPVVELIIKEMTDAGINDILVVTSRRKKPLEDYFDREVELEVTFTGEGVVEKLRLIDPVDANVFFIRQKHMAGTGDALLLTEPFVGDSPFVVAYPDDILINGPSLSGQLIEVYQKTGCTVLAVQDFPQGDISRYGVVDTGPPKGGVEYVKKVVEKPPMGTEPSRLVTYGRYLYSPEIFSALKEEQSRFIGDHEFTQTDAINLLAAQDKVVVKRFDGHLLDVGSPNGYMQAVVEYGLSRPDLRPGLLPFLREIMKREDKSNP
ncbi:MAG: UTP--glucose-1-phosphate uridylyltransferase [Deltaproteobacteria bacterium]|nr:UTP--glucose-1-phosphate uridylyltransferase [Deltaproteobacteria bacterium]